MISAVVVDDERRAVEKLERMLLRQEGIEVVGSFTNPETVLARMAALKPDVLFLDIEMPGIKGLELAEQVLAVCDDVDVVFVTAFDQYAVEAFEVSALDYLLKPVAEERLARTVSRIMARRGAGHNQARFGRVLCFGKFEVQSAAAQPLAINWRTAKARELFAYFFQHRNSPVDRERVVEALWPGLGAEPADRLFHTTTYYLRKILRGYGYSDILQFARNNQYVLNLEQVDSDVDEFQRLLGPALEDSYLDTEKAVHLYRGDYMEEEYFRWAAGERERLLQLYLGAVQRLSRYWSDQWEYARAEIFLRKWLAKEPLAEEAQCMLMKAYAKKGNHEQLVRQYENYRSILLEDLGAEPGRSVKQLFYRLLHDSLD